MLLISAYWGVALGLFTSVLSAAAFDFFHLPSVGGLSLSDGRDWVGLSAFVVVAAVVSGMAEALAISSAAIELGVSAGDERRVALALRDADGAPIASLMVPRGLSPEIDERLRVQVAPALGALVAIALRRDAMQSEAVETAALRRSDDVKTALLRTVLATE